jgi:hypothetical protein
MMKKGMPWVIIFLLVISMALSVNAFGASSLTPVLTYNPDFAQVNLAPGEEKPVDVEVTLENGQNIQGLVFCDLFVEGDHVATVPPLVIFYPANGTIKVKTQVTVKAPEDAEPGDTYSAHITATASVQGTSATIDTGGGSVIDVVVQQSETEPQCAAPPTVRITQSEPEVVWTPNKEMVEVTIKGTVDPGENCTLASVGYTVKDEYEEFDAEKTATVEPDGRLLAPDNLTMDVDGNVTLKVTVEASRRGGDENGRNYGIRLTAANEEGNGKSQLVTVTVSHDQGKQKEAKR